MRSAVTISLVPEARGGPFVFWDDLEEGCRQAASLGYDAVELFPRLPQDFDPGRIREVLRRHSVGLAAVGTGSGWVAHRLRFTDADPEIRRRARAFAAEMIDRAGALGAPAILGSMQGRWEGAITREQALAWLGEALEELGPRAERHGTPLLLEPLNRYETNLLSRVGDALDLLKGLRTQNVKLLCDLFHMNIEEADIAAGLRLAGARLGHVHFADSNRLALGLGHTDLAPVVDALRAIGYRGYGSAEVLPLPSPADAARQWIRRFRELTVPQPATP